MKTYNIIYAEKSYKGRNKIEVNAFVSLAHLVTSSQGRKDTPGMFGLYTYYSTAFAVPAAVFTHGVAEFPGSAVLLFGAFGATLAQTCVALVNRILN